MAVGNAWDACHPYTFTVVTDPTILSVADQPQPSLQVRNTFNYAEVSVSKTVETLARDNDGNPITFGPFQMALQCTFIGADVTATEDMTQTLADGDTFTWTGLPEGADCVVEETDTADATTIVHRVTNAGIPELPAEGARVTLEPLPQVGPVGQSAVAFVNVFPVDPLIIRKTLAGNGAAEVTRTFPVHVYCRYTDESHPAPGVLVKDTTVEIGGPDNLEVEIDFLPIGSVCTITELDTGGATSVSMTGTPYAGHPDDDGELGATTASNGASITVTLTRSHFLVDITNTFINPLPPTGGLFAWMVPIGAALAMVIGLMFVLWRRFEPRRD